MTRRLLAVNEIGKPIGEDHHNAKLTNADVDLIFALRDEGMTLREIGEKFEVRKAAIWKILHGHRRAHTPSAWVPPGGRKQKPRATAQRKAQPTPAPDEHNGAVLLQQTLTTVWR